MVTDYAIESLAFYTIIFTQLESPKLFLTVYIFEEPLCVQWGLVYYRGLQLLYTTFPLTTKIQAGSQQIAVPFLLEKKQPLHCIHNMLTTFQKKGSAS